MYALYTFCQTCKNMQGKKPADWENIVKIGHVVILLIFYDLFHICAFWW